MKFYIIPNIKDINKWNDLSYKYNLGFEYNDFYLPNILDDKDSLDLLIEKYLKLNRKDDTLHGVFFDINFASVDRNIKEISIKRAKTSLEIATKLNCKAVIFHTNYQTWIKDNKYKDSWVKESAKVYKELLNEYPQISIYVENMFDDDPILLSRLAEELKDEIRFGVCLDVAHAHISSTPLKMWFDKLSPYIKHIHLNDNDKVLDLHSALSEGNLDYKYVLSKVLELDDKITILLEMNKYDDVIKSLKVIGGDFYDFK
jgi:sugar phosphate isomerase/epimerase